MSGRHAGFLSKCTAPLRTSLNRSRRHRPRRRLLRGGGGWQWGAATGEFSDSFSRSGQGAMRKEVSEKMKVRAENATVQVRLADTKK